ncbi:protein FAM222B-like [Embiotoca jacksoni]|uniref:protein FAM222B-like n=1 Tax=Embiotoca jacksoni TaxID=100190 RepID=UPI003703AF6A
MLACLPASGDHTIRLLSRTQMNTGLQKWETTQKMRSASYPTPAELDAYAKKVANNPLTIQIFPNSIKVPQRKHIRRTVNGLDTSSSSQRHSPYPSQVSTSRGLLAVLRPPAKGVIKDSDGSRARQLHKAVMNPHSGPYPTQSTLNLPQPAPHLQGPSLPAAQKQGMVHPQALQQQQQQQQQTMTHPMALQQSHPQALQQRNMAHSQALQRQQSLTQVPASQQQRLAHPQGIQRQQSLPHSQVLQQQQQQQQQQQGQSCPPVIPQQHLPHLQTLKHQTAPPQASLTQQGVTQDLRHISDGAPLPSLQHTQGLVGSQALSQAVAAGPPSMPNSLQQPPPGPYGPRKLPDADAPPNVTVSTSTIPLSMAASLHQNRPSDLSSIVHQINQLCQARAGMGTTSVCEGQIANPSPISRNLLINASSRVSSHHPAMGNVPGCLMVGPPDKAPALTPNAALHSQPSLAATNSISAFHTDPEKVQLQQQQQLQHRLHQQKQQQLQQQQQQQHLQQLQQLQHQQHQQRSWAQHQLAHMQQLPEGAHPCKNPRMEPPAECAFPSRNLNYPHKLPNTAQSFPLKHPAEKPGPSSPINCPAVSNPYMNGHYMQPPWSGIPTTAGNNGSGPQDLPVAFHRGQAAAAAATDRVPGAKYRPGKEGPPGQSKMMQNVDFLGGDFQMPRFQEQNMDVMEKMHRSVMGQVQEPSSSSSSSSSSRGVHTHHPGYR